MKNLDSPEPQTYIVTIRFYEELNDFLPINQRKRDIEHSFPGRRSVKDLIESLGVPHVEVDLILVNSDSVGFSYIVHDNDRISIYPVFETFAIEGVTRLRPSPLREPRFVLDVHLGKLARGLRLLGFDVDYAKERNKSKLTRISETEKRTLLTRDRQLLIGKNLSRGLYIRNTNSIKQLDEVVARLNLYKKSRPFTRCIECNGLMRNVDYDGSEFISIKKRIPAGVLEWCTEYYRCENCKKIYWKGSHYKHLKDMVNKILMQDSAE